MGLLADIEKRFTIVPRVIDDVEAAARSQIGQELLAAGKVILSFLPEGREAALVLTKLEEAEQWAHKALAAGSAVVSDVQGETAAVAADVPAPAAAPPAVPEPPSALPADEPVMPVPTGPEAAPPAPA